MKNSEICLKHWGQTLLWRKILRSESLSSYRNASVKRFGTSKMCRMIFTKFFWFIWLKVLQISAPGVYGQELNQILNVFSSCYTDLIFSKSVPDIAPPDYPILVSTPQARISVTPSTIRRNESLILVSNRPAECFPSFVSIAVHQIITIRLNCVALVILNANSREEIRSAVRNRHNWIHLTTYPEIKILRSELETIPLNYRYYSGDVYISSVLNGAEGFGSSIIDEPIWLWDLTEPVNNIFTLYLWRLYESKFTDEIELRIILNPACGTIFKGSVSGSGFNVRKLNDLYDTGIQKNCQYLFFVFSSASESRTSTEEVPSYYGPPPRLPNLIYPKESAVGQLLHNSAPFLIIASLFSNSTALSAPDLEFNIRVTQEYEYLIIRHDRNASLILMFAEIATLQP